MLRMIDKMRQLIDRILRSADGRIVAANFGYLMILRVASFAFPLITIPYLARVIGVDGFGKIAFAAAVVGWFQTVSDWGFNYTATRDVARRRENLGELSRIFSYVLWARLLLMMLSFIVLYILILIIPYFSENKTILLLTFLVIPGHILFPIWFFQAIERMGYITTLDLISKLAFTAMVFLFIRGKSDYIFHPIIVGLGYATSGLLSLYIIIIKWKISIVRPNLQSIKLALRDSANVFLNNLAPNLYNSFSTVLLGLSAGNTSNGLLDAGRRFSDVFQQFLQILSQVFFPLLSRKLHVHNFYVKLNLSGAILMASTLYVASPLIISTFYSPEFKPAVSVLQIMSLSIVFTSLNSIYGINYLVIAGHEKDLRNITLIVSLVGLSASVPMIYFFDYIGAASAVSLTRILLGCAVAIRARKIKKQRIGGL